ncbi:MAG: hypothetical protein JST00_10825 [Deltaproteobacteria bacterium]|nr:hypothetical protein [Deltaproteobacteria bacterium]
MHVRALLLGLGMLGLSACTLLVGTTGLSDGASSAGEGGVDGASLPSEAATDAMVDGAGDASTDADAAVGLPCVGRSEVTGWGSFTKEPGANVTIAGDKLTATASTTGVGQKVREIANYDPAGFVPSRVRVAYQVTFEPSASMYFEPGCSIHVIGPNGTVLRHIPTVDGTRLVEYLNVYKSGADDDRTRTITTSLASNRATHSFDVTISLSGSSALVETIVDGTPGRFDGITLEEKPTGYYVNCGIPYGSQTSGPSGSLTVDVRGMAITACR